MSTFHEIEARRARYAAETAIRHDERRRLVAILTRNAQDDQRISRRVKCLAFLLSDADERGKAKVLADAMGVTESAFSQALSAMEAELANTENLSPLPGDQKSGKLVSL